MKKAAKRLTPERPAGRSTPAKPDIAALAERFAEPLPGDATARQPAIPELPLERAHLKSATPEPVPSADSAPEPQAFAPFPSSLPEPSAKRGLSRNALVTALVALALIPLALLIVLLLQDRIRPSEDGRAPFAGLLGPAESVYAKKDTARLTAQANADKDATPASAEVTGSLPSNASGWSLSPDKPGAIPFWVPDQTGPSEMAAALEPTVTETRPQAASPDIAAAVPPPSRKPAPTSTEPPVRTVKVVTIKPPGEKKPYDGAYALGAPADEPQGSGEWMVTKTAVDMHASAEQKSETVKIAQGGLKVRVTSRDKNWIQVHDPKSSTTGWIYNRFLKPADADAQ